MIVLLFAFIMLRARAMILGKPFLPDSWKKTYKQYRLRNNKSKSGGNIAIANSVAGGIPAILTMMGGAISSNNTTSNSNSSSRSGSSSRGGNGNGNGKGKHQPKMSGKFSFSTFITHKKTDTNSEPNTYLSDQKVNKTMMALRGRKPETHHRTRARSRSRSQARSRTGSSDSLV